ncbi:NAD(P)-dependent dehydrogenase (short-subunit alcohol dehydrogenase family) [Halarchaeum rubridurum]|uniref:NAD(P)-dependent dehydrogenase (Short-subunit alcohol dehydrogenase family) n=1 Tax=Halarchaeum rubridurum TaxID=489911 RepID=A0A830FPJ7_9EURY|nr:SDR family oxidoreductase [Halarchaeum rubridurum]MBP1954191.1 NAD(P)-dependent dehydrogenase (short-subunit alcohol dehydrogenase family) [Halarchaeum rubridurum]GGM58045.1 oxidoreductase [Halarchaeum rubridurum]
MALDHDGETALVTASTSGLGKASATALAADGANVVLCGRDEERLDAALADVREEAAAGVEGVNADITDPGDVEALVDATVEAFGGLDHLVCSAGGPPSGPFLDTDDADWYDAYDLLVMSVVRAVNAAHPHLAASDAGTVTAITSTTVERPIEGLVLSNAVRRGVVGLVETLAVELAPDVRANAVLPGTFETPRIGSLVEQGVERGDYADYEAGIEEWGSGIPEGRVGDPRELGEVIAFLTSERASYVNGVSLPVDGGVLLE